MILPRWTLPGWRAWVFSGKAFLAACLALYLAFWMDLPRPYWAMTTVYVVAQPLAGTTVSKALYRLMGTMLGGVGAVLLVPNLVNSPALLVLALSLWTGCCLFLSLRDRRPHSYVFMLAGYTAPIIGFPSVDAPGDIFTTAVSRVQEIGLGIVCASVVGAIVLPQAVGVLFGARVKAWLGHATGWAREVLGDDTAETVAGPMRARLAADAIEIDTLASHLGFDPRSPRGARGSAEKLRSRMLLLLPLTSSIANRLRALAPYSLTPPIRYAMAGLRTWLAAGAPAAEGEALRRSLAAAAPELGPAACWPDLLQANLAARLQDLVNLHLDCAALQASLLGAPGKPVLALPDIDGLRGTGARHTDLGLALRSAAAAVAAMLVGAWFWIATAWPEGSSMLVGIAVGCSFFSTFDNPVGPQLKFATWSFVAVLVGAVYGYAVLPLAQEFETLMLLLMPLLIVAGLVAFNPATAIVGLAVAANLPALLGLQERYTADFAGFVNGGIGLVAGLWFAAVFTSVARVVQPRWVARRLLGASYRAVAAAAEQRGQGDRELFASKMLDRAGQMAPRIAAGEAWPDMMEAVRIGLNVVDLRRARHGLPAAMVAKLDLVLDGLAASFRARAGSRGELARRLRVAVLDDALTEAAALPAGALRDGTLQGLVGIRLGLFRHAAGYAPPASLGPPLMLEQAA